MSIALKAVLYEVFHKAGISQRRLARDLDVAESEVRRMLNPEHATKAATMDRALYQLGQCVSVAGLDEASLNRRKRVGPLIICADSGDAFCSGVEKSQLATS